MSESPVGPVAGRPFPAAPMYGPRTVGTSPLNLAFLGRVSDEDLQDPTLSLPRQATSCQTVLPPGARIVAYYWDIESGRIDPSKRGRSDAYKKFAVPIPRDGGIRELLDAAARGPAFDAVICEAIDRVARRTYFGVKIEHDLERCGVPLLAADEGIQNLRKRATQILTRRVKQATSEWYVLETLEKAWDGFCEHATQGWNIGSPPYGYLAERIPHPVPAKRAAGSTKTRLAWDPVRAPVVQKIFEWRTVGRKSRQDIANLLNEDPDLYPPPAANDGRRTRGSWSAATVNEILDNPKYTGYMVWNRRARNTARGKRNPPEL
ncbi:recombinase family protein [Frankia sp. KB5]|uniref:recombinase family protein n=2 Tax=Frankia TaxID=1854 RepID=UPI0018E29CDC|nr:recombinase family protein [Frankia sp. KB5]